MLSSMCTVKKLGKQPGLWLLPFLMTACAMPQQPPPKAPQPTKPTPAAVSYALPNLSASTPKADPSIQAERKQPAGNNSEAPIAATDAEKNRKLEQVQTLIGQNNAQAALALLDAHDRQWGANYRSIQLRADSLRKTSQLDQAELLYKSLLDAPERTTQGSAWYGLGKVAIERGDLKTATTHMEKAIELDPVNTKAYSDLGLVYLLGGQKEPAHNNLMKANDLANGDPQIMLNLALWGLVFDDFNMAMEIADNLQWSDKARNQLMSQANTIKRRFDNRGNTQ